MSYRTSVILLIVLSSCIHPGKLSKLPSNAKLQSSDCQLDLSTTSGNVVTAQYLGCGGLYLQQDGSGIMIDPFFSSQGLWKLGTSVLSKDARKCNIKSDRKMVEFGLQAIEKETGSLSDQVEAIFTAHSHYDHLMDVPAVFSRLQKKPMIYVSRSGQAICSNVIDPAHRTVLEEHMTTQDMVRPPIVVTTKTGRKINVYPILADHNPHLKNIKAFAGSTTRPLKYFTKPYDKTRANDWLEGSTFSFVIDYLGAADAIELRLFVQSSSCNPPAGIPPLALRQLKKVDVAFLGVASYEASPDYPKELLSLLTPGKVVWIHWEDFFRSYSKDPKTVRATNVRRFFQEEVSHLPYDSYTPWPRIKIDIRY
jgi:hypothetical protein